MTGRHRRPSAARATARTTIRAGSLCAAAAGLGVILTDGASQAATTHAQHLAHLAHLAAHPVTLTAHTASAGGSFQACVINRESGGNPHAVNPYSGAGGLYQFLPATWRGLGYSGSPQNAPVAVQNEAFARLYAQAGRGPWSSDGC